MVISGLASSSEEIGTIGPGREEYFITDTAQNSQCRVMARTFS
jgi:hypothetical protein